MAGFMTLQHLCVYGLSSFGMSLFSVCGIVVAHVVACMVTVCISRFKKKEEIPAAIATEI